jgi:hypothetical protein
MSFKKSDLPRAGKGAIGFFQLKGQTGDRRVGMPIYVNSRVGFCALKALDGQRGPVQWTARYLNSQL